MGLACSAGAPFTPPGHNIVVSVGVSRCSGGCVTTSGPLDTLNRGDTAQVRLSVSDTTGDSSVVLLRAPCAVNVTILGGTGTAPTLPAAPSCPDSAVSGIVGPVPLLRDLLWVVPQTLSVGDYTLRCDLVIDPPVPARRTIRID